MNNNTLPNNTTSPLPVPITRYDEEFFETAYPEDNDFPESCLTFYEINSDTVWIRNNTPDSLWERNDTIRFHLDHDFPENQDLIIDCLEVNVYATGDHSDLTIELYLDNILLTSVPYNHGDINRLDLKKLNISEKDRTLTYNKNIMVRFTQNECPYLKMGIGCASPGLPAGHIKGCLKTRNRLLPKSTYQYLTDHNKNITGLANAQGNIAATWDYDAFGNIIHQTGTPANQNPLRFSSEYHDEDLGLIYYNYRHYNPQNGRWISRDPIGEKDDWNLYKSFGNSGLYHIDYLGLVKPGGLPPNTEPERTDNKLTDLESRMLELCECSCCKIPSKQDSCKESAKKIAEKINQLWSQVQDGTIESGPNINNKHAVKGYLCWDWAEAFERIAQQELQNDKSWSFRVERVDNSNMICHFYLVLCACSKNDNKKCCLTVDDGFFGTGSYVRNYSSWCNEFKERGYKYHPNNQRYPQKGTFCPGVTQIPFPK